MAIERVRGIALTLDMSIVFTGPGFDNQKKKTFLTIR
jgi:hypothetical protein